MIKIASLLYKEASYLIALLLNIINVNTDSFAFID